MDLPLYSAAFLAFALMLYVFLDGFDLGVGILLLFQKHPASRDHMVDSIMPTWDGNETWIIMAGVTLLAAFPVAYSILLPALYLPIMLMLLALGFRGVSFEFRVQAERHRRSWDVAFAIGSLLAAFMQGLIAGCLIQGIKVRDLRFDGSPLDILHPVPLIGSATVVVVYVVLGAGWLKLKSNFLVQQFASRSLRVSAPLFLGLFLITCIFAVYTLPNVRLAWQLHRVGLSCLVGLMPILVATLIVFNGKNARAIPFYFGMSLCALGISGIALIVFPNIVPFEVSLWEAASSSASQQFVLVGAAIVTPVVLGYSAFAYWIFRGRTPEKGWEE